MNAFNSGDFDDLDSDFSVWLEDFEISSVLSAGDVQSGSNNNLDSRFIWTEHTTCEEIHITNGLRDYSGSCCWRVIRYWIANKPCDQKFMDLQISATTTCNGCSKFGQSSPEKMICSNCGGAGIITYSAAESCDLISRSTR